MVVSIKFIFVLIVRSQASNLLVSGNNAALSKDVLLLEESNQKIMKRDRVEAY